MSHRSTDPADPRTPAPAGPADGHLAPARLAALADEPPTAAEGAHLRACAACTVERRSHEALLGHARAARVAVAPPLTDWAALAGALRAEGLLAPAEVAPAPGEPTGPATVHALDARRRRRLPAWGLRAAAALLLAAGGAAVGRASAGAPVVPALAAADDEDARVRAILADSAPMPQSQAEAIAVLTRAERDYRFATQFLADRTDPVEGADRSADYQRRLAVMDEVASLTRAALYEAPHDPVLNQYYLASLSAREATLRQLGTVLPAGAQINRF